MMMIEMMMMIMVMIIILMVMIELMMTRRRSKRHGDLLACSSLLKMMDWFLLMFVIVNLANPDSGARSWTGEERWKVVDQGQRSRRVGRSDGLVVRWRGKGLSDMRGVARVGVAVNCGWEQIFFL